MVRRLLRRSAAVRPHRHLPRHPLQRQNGRRMLWLRLHRWIGIAATLFLAVVAVTGVLANHAHELGLDRSHPRAGWLLRWYGVAPGEVVAAEVDGRWLLWSDGRLSLDQVPIAAGAPRLVGAVAYQDMLVAAGIDLALVLTAEGEVVDRLDGAALPGPIARVGLGPNGELIVDTTSGAYVADEALLQWAHTAQPVQWSQAREPPAALREAVAMPATITWERLLLDLHSGRLFGIAGTLFNDLVALALLFLAGSGLYNWWLRRN